MAVHVYTDSQTTLAATTSFVAACMPQQTLHDIFLTLVKGSRSMDQSQSSSCALSGMRVGATDKRLHHAMHAPGSAWISPQSTGNCQQGHAKHMAIWTPVEGGADLVRWEFCTTASIGRGTSANMDGRRIGVQGR